jgi:multimeric flavodoxin WrbA
MRIAVLNGSPKGSISVTMQYVRYLEKESPEHVFDVLHIAQRINQIEHDAEAFRDTLHRIAMSDGVLWAFPLYFCLVHSNYKRFIELIWSRGAKDTFEGKPTASLSTSIHFFDHTAHNYIRAISEDLNMRYRDAFSADMQDLLTEEGRRKLLLFGEDFFRVVDRQTPSSRLYPPLQSSEYRYEIGDVGTRVATEGKRIVVLSDAEPIQVNLQRMIQRFTDSFDGPVETFNLHDIDIKGGCLGCLACGYDNRCTYEGKDQYTTFFKFTLEPADILVFAGSVKDRYLSSRWKMFFDRSFFMNHAPSLSGKQLGFLISGPVSRCPDLRQVLEAWVEMQDANLAGIATDEFSTSREIDNVIDGLAHRMVRLSNAGYVRPRTFLGVGGRKIFRDDIYGRLRIVFQADHRAYKRLGVYDFPQKDLKTRAFNAVLTPLLKIPKMRREFTVRIKEQMIQPYQKLFKT